MTICLKYGKIKYVCKKLPQKNDLLRRYKEEADMSLLQAILMGIIQGLTEFLPVSSSGHLAIFKILFGVDTDTGLLFDVLLHIGTLAAICIVYYKDVLKMIVEGIGIIRDCFINLIRFIGNKTGKTDEPYLRIVNSSYRKLVVLIIVSTIPTGIIGVVGKDVVKNILYVCRTDQRDLLYSDSCVVKGINWILRTLKDRKVQRGQQKLQ